jgi:hypothetical protein
LLDALDDGVTRITVLTKAINNWTPGAHVFLSIPKFGPGQSHPTTITSIPSSHSGDLVFISKGQKGFTYRLLKSATNSKASFLSAATESPRSPSTCNLIALIDGPYDGSHTDFASFDSVLLISGSTGTIFTLPILLDLVARASKAKLPIKRIIFLWIIENTSWTSWISSELTTASEALHAAGIELSILIHVTCDEKFTTGETEVKEYDCGCDKSLGECCCTNIKDSERKSDVANEKGKVVDAGETRSSVDILARSRSPAVKPGTKSKILPCAEFYSGRPDFYELLWAMLEVAEGETGVAVCGPLGLKSSVRKSVVGCSNQKVGYKGTEAEGIYLHSESFGW